jgi:hypothetical protein
MTDWMMLTSAVCMLIFKTKLLQISLLTTSHQMLSVACLGIFIKVITLGMGKHAIAVDPANVFIILKYFYFYSICIILAYSFIKLSIGFFLLRLADRTNWRKFLQGTLSQSTMP